ncbi:MAG: type II toxin-antitoxin system RelE/ParE family toxin [Flavobacteriaceae bacterium]|jgi:plasmid stabilization system protein ParE|nr:type II toxin-antitoxin system RelE/ParE family toxin [Flavobacteriaceae bacterium]
MDYKLIITPDAQLQLDEALTYYKNKASKKVARNFLEEYRNTCETILEVLYFQFYFLEFRAVPMKKFPFLVFYTLNEDKKLVIIKAVFHTSQNPDKYPGQ